MPKNINNLYIVYILNEYVCLYVRGKMLYGKCSGTGTLIITYIHTTEICFANLILKAR